MSWLLNPFVMTGVSVLSISPNTGAVNTDIPVTITGTGFTGVTRIRYVAYDTSHTYEGGFTVVSDTTITNTFHDYYARVWTVEVYKDAQWWTSTVTITTS